ncbi:MAG: WD40/YVTN/BNR-like repeat-containing protein [Acidimicrobiales bacterium]
MMTDHGVRVTQAGLVAATDDGIWSSDGSRTLGGHRVDDLDGAWALLDGDALWRDGVEQVRLPGPAATCVAAPGDGVLVGTKEAHLLSVKGGVAEPLESFEKAEGRDRWYTPWGGPPDVRTVAAAPDGTLYVNVHVGGILRSDDGGSSWSPTIDVDADVHEVLAHGESDVLAATALGFARSHDRGRTWTYATAGLVGTYSRAIAVAGDWLLLSASTGPFTGQAAVYRRPLDADDDVPFERCSDWFTANVNTGRLAGGDGPQAAMASPDGDLYVSDDAGATWRQVAAGLGTVNRLRLST